MTQIAAQPTDLFLIVRTYPVRRVVGTAHSEAEAIKSVRSLEAAARTFQTDSIYTHELNPKYPN